MNDAANRIQDQMEAIRGQLNQSVDTALTSARRATEWRNYVRKYPWACLGVAAAIGYVVVPRRLEVRQPDVDTLLKLAERKKLVLQANPPETKQRGMGQELSRLAAKLAMRAAMGYLGRQLGKTGAGKNEAPKNPANTS